MTHGSEHPGEAVRRSVARSQLLPAAALMGILLLLSVLQTRQFDASKDLREQVNQSYETRAQIDSILSLHQDLETGQRGFVLTGNPAFLEPYQSARVRLAPAHQGLRTRMADQRELDGTMTELEDLTRRKLEFSARAVSLRAQGRAVEATALVAGGQGKAVMDRIRRVIARMDAIERANLEASIARADTSRQVVQLLTYGLQALLLVLLLGAGWIINRNLAAARLAAERLRDLSVRQQAIFDSGTDGMIIHDPQGIIESLNPATARMHGYSGTDLVGRHIGVLFENPPEQKELEAFLNRLAKKPTGHASRVQELSGKRSDGTIFSADVATSPVQLAEGLRFLAMIRDATERKRVDRLKTEFVSTVSHELRTPLTSIAGSLGLLAGGAAGALPDRAARLITIAHANSERLIRLINDILDIEKIESGKMTFEVKPVPLRQLVHLAIHANTAYASEYGVGLRLAPGGEGALAMVDPDRLMQVMTNLISNACKFSPAETEVQVAVIEGEKTHRITVSDRGPGIPEEFKQRIFAKFAQADSSDTRQKGGTGLGLSIVKEIVTRFGGKVSFDSEAGRGTSFHVDLPATTEATEDGQSAPPAEPAAPLASEHEAGAKLPSILHIEDDPDVLRVVASAFEGRAALDPVTDIAAARAALRTRPYDLVILDVALPSGSGMELMPDMRREDGTLIPVVIFSSQDDEPEVSRQVEAMLTKSRASLGDLIEAVEAALPDTSDEKRS